MSEELIKILLSIPLERLDPENVNANFRVGDEELETMKTRLKTKKLGGLLESKDAFWRTPPPTSSPQPCPLSQQRPREQTLSM